MKNKIKITNDKNDGKYVEIPISFKLKVYLDEETKKINIFQLEKEINKLDRIDLGEMVLNNIDTDLVETEIDTDPEPEKKEVPVGDVDDNFWD